MTTNISRLPRAINLRRYPIYLLNCFIGCYVSNRGNYVIYLSLRFLGPI